MPPNSSRTKQSAGVRSPWSASSPGAPPRRAAAWVMRAPSSPAARATLNPRSPRWNRPALWCRRRRRVSARRWSRFLPKNGRRSSQMRGSSPRFLAVAAGILVLIVVALAFRIVSPSDIVSRDQSRTVSYTVDMAVNGDFVLAVDANGFPATKPPLYNYLSLPLVKAFGPGVWTFTFPSLIAYFATLALVYVIARFTFAGMGSEPSLWGLSKFEWATLLAVIFYAISPMALRLALVARPDMVLIFFLTLAFYAATRALALPRQENG